MSKKSWHFWESDIWHKSSNICTATLRTVTSWSSGMWIRYGNTACSNNSSYEDWLGQGSYVWQTWGIFLYVKFPPGYTVLAIWEVESRKLFHDILKCKPFLYLTGNSLATKTSLRSWKHKRTNRNHTQNCWTEKNLICLKFEMENHDTTLWFGFVWSQKKSSERNLHKGVSIIQGASRGWRRDNQLHSWAARSVRHDLNYCT